MEIIKEFLKDEHDIPNRTGVCVIRTNTYAKNIQYFNELHSVAIRDFPTLKPETIEVVHYGGIHYKRTFGIEFVITADPPNDYKCIDALETTL